MKQIFYFLLAFLCVGVIARAYPQDDFGDFGDFGGDDGGGGGSDLDVPSDTSVDQSSSDISTPEVEPPPADTPDTPSTDVLTPDTSDSSTNQTPPDTSIQPIDQTPADTSTPPIDQPPSPPVDPDSTPVVEPPPTPPAAVDPTPVVDPPPTPPAAVDPTPIVEPPATPPAVVDPTPVVEPPVTPPAVVDSTPIIDPPTTDPVVAPATPTVEPPVPTSPEANNGEGPTATPAQGTDLPLESPSVTSPPISDDPGTSALPSDVEQSPSSVVGDDDNTTLAPEITSPASMSDVPAEVTPATDASLATASDGGNPDTAAATETVSPTASSDDTASTAAATEVETSTASDLTATSTAAAAESSYSATSASNQASSTANSDIPSSATVAAATSMTLTSTKSPQVTQKPSQPAPTTFASKKATSNPSTAANKAQPSKKPKPTGGAKPTTPTNDFVTYIRKVYELALHHGGRNPNRLVMEWLRHEDYDNFQWTQLVSSIDETFIQAVNNSGIQMIRTLTDPGTGIDIKVSHLGACMNGVFMYGQPAQPATNRADVTGWGGDLITFYGDWQLAVQGGQRRGGGGRRRRRGDDNYDPHKRATSLPGGDYARQHMATRTDANTFKLHDMIEDADCYNIATTLRSNPTLSIADEIQANLASGYKTRMQRFYNGRFGSAGAAQAVVRDMLVPGGDVLVNAGRTKLVFDVAGWGTTVPVGLKKGKLDDFTRGVADRFQALVVEEARGSL